MDEAKARALLAKKREILDRVDDAIAPRSATAEEALAFLQELADDLETMREAIGDDIRARQARKGGR